jgi:hypothetical protein
MEAIDGSAPFGSHQANFDSDLLKKIQSKCHLMGGLSVGHGAASGGDRSRQHAGLSAYWKALIRQSFRRVRKGDDSHLEKVFPESGV